MDELNNGNVIASNSTPNTTPNITPAITPAAPPVPQRLNINDALKLYSQYSKIAHFIPKYTEDTYRQSIQSAYNKYNNKPIYDAFTPAQKANVEKLKIATTGNSVPLCIAGSCKVLNEAGDQFKGQDNVDGIYFGNQTAATHLKDDGFIPAPSPTALKRGDLLQIMMNKGQGNFPQHAMLFDSYINDEQGKPVGVRMFENHGDGVEKYVSFTNNPKYIHPGDDTSTFNWDEGIKNFNPTTSLPGNQAGIQAWTKSPEAIKAMIDQKNKEREDMLKPIRDKLVTVDPRFNDDNYAHSTFMNVNQTLPKPQQQKIYAQGGGIEMNGLDRATITVEGKKYEVAIACDDASREEGLQGVTHLADNEGMLFCFDEPTDVAFWMKDTLIPLDLIYVDEYGEVKSIHQGTPLDEEQFHGSGIKYVLELNAGSSVKVGDEVDLSDVEKEEDEYKLHVVAPDGNTQMELKGGERIFSRPNTRTLVSLSKRAYKSKEDRDYKALGRRVFKYLHVQDTKEDDYVELPTK